MGTDRESGRRKIRKQSLRGLRRRVQAYRSDVTSHRSNRSSSQPQVGSSDEEGSDQLPARGPRILIVEDNLDTLSLMEMILEDIGNPTLATSAKDALKAARKAADGDGAGRPVDVFLLDINLGHGETNGVELLNALRGIPAYASTPIAAVTAYAMPRDRRRILALGFDDFLGKPFTVDELIQMVQRLTSDGKATST